MKRGFALVPIFDAANRAGRVMLGGIMFTRPSPDLLQDAPSPQRLIVYRMPTPLADLAGAPELAEPRHDQDGPWARDDVEERLFSGSKLFALRENNQSVSFAWVTERTSFWADEIEADLVCPTPMTWIWDCFTPEPHRGRGHYPRLIRTLAVRFGTERAIIFASEDNISSVRGIMKAGFLPWREVLSTNSTLRIRKLREFPGELCVLRRQASASEVATGGADS